MPTSQTWLEQDVALTVWERPLMSEEVRECFLSLAQMIDSKKPSVVHVVFNITASGFIPVVTPRLAVLSGYLTRPNTGKVVVVGMDGWAQSLARIAVSLTGKDIHFFGQYEAALDFVKSITS